MTLRRLGVLLTYLPPEAASVRASGGAGWTRQEYLIADLWHAIAKTPHPSLPKTNQRSSADQARRVEAFKARAAERQRQIDAGEII